jgi:DNA-binding NarL/FixJ family response regulator
MQILVVDDHVLIREAIRGLLKELDNDVAILESADCRGAMELFADHPNVDLILLDLTLPDRDGFSMLAELRERDPAVPVVILSAHSDRSSVLKAFELGALGFIPKSGPREVMIIALRLILAGGIYVPPEILASEERSIPGFLSKRPGSSPSPSDLGLTYRQLDVLTLMVKGNTNKEISRILNMAEPTVKNHVGAIFRMLQVTNRVEAVRLVGELGWELSSSAKR